MLVRVDGDTAILKVEDERGNREIKIETTARSSILVDGATALADVKPGAQVVAMVVEGKVTALRSAPADGRGGDRRGGEPLRRDGGRVMLRGTIVAAEGKTFVLQVFDNETVRRVRVTPTADTQITSAGQMVQADEFKVGPAAVGGAVSVMMTDGKPVRIEVHQPREADGNR